MARGWESKSVEQQIQSARERAGEDRVKLTPEQIEIERQRDSLQLQRKRVQRQIEECTDDRYRKTLESGLQYLDGQISKLA